jgi:SAM-dependent methyltransferase
VNIESQQNIWRSEHKKPEGIKQLDSQDLSSGISLFLDWLTEKEITVNEARIIEICCGKGRNLLGLAKYGAIGVGLDFAEPAIETARERAAQEEVTGINFHIEDVTGNWAGKYGVFDMAIDCFATADLETPELRANAAKQLVESLRPGGLILVYTLSSDDMWSKEGLKNAPLTEKNTYKVEMSAALFKFEKCFDLVELQELYSGLDMIESKRISKSPRYAVNGKEREFPALHHWVIFQKPLPES